MHFLNFFVAFLVSGENFRSSFAWFLAWQEPPRDMEVKYEIIQAIRWLEK